MLGIMSRGEHQRPEQARTACGLDPLVYNSGMRTLLLASLNVLAITCVAHALDGDHAWYVVVGMSGQCRPMGNVDPMVFERVIQQQPGGVIKDEKTGGSITDRSQVPGVLERIVDDGHGHIGGLVFVQGADTCRVTAETMRDLHLLPYQQRE